MKGQGAWPSRDPIPVGFEQVCPYVCHLVGEVERVKDLAASTGSRTVWTNGETISESGRHMTVSGAGLKGLMSRMGHDRLRTAMIYRHAVRGADKLLAEAIEKMETV
jgi:hypothetical protein